MACKCYHAERNFLGKIGVCWGTKECEACSCGGDESKCDFYEDKRKKATPKRTHGDNLRASTDEELAMWVETIAGCDRCLMLDEQCSGGEVNSRASCKRHWLEWLRQEA